MTDLTQLLLRLSAEIGVSGKEERVCAFLEKEVAPFGQTTVTPLGTLLCTLRPAKTGRPHLLLAAHMDEVGFVVRYIEENGFLRLACIGGIDPKLFLGSLVNIHTRQGAQTGIICSTPPHLQGGEEAKLPKAEDLYVDTGLTDQQCREAIALGDRVTFFSTPHVLLDGSVSGKALDDRACCAAMVHLAGLLQGKEVDCGVTLAFTTMEETGSQGAKTAAYQVAPTHALALDVSFGHSHDAKKHLCGEMGKGPMIGLAPILSDSIANQLVALCKQESIPYQWEVMGGSTGTDADSMATSHAGVATGLVSIPQRYMHAPIERVHPKDVEETARLLYHWVMAMSREGKNA